MSEYGFRPPYVWYVPKPINLIDRILRAFEVLREEFINETWSSFQLKFSKKLEEKSIKFGHSGAMGSRNWFTTFKYLGLAYVDKKKLICLTDVGNSINKKNEKEIVINQLLKLQYPNPYQSKFVKDVNLFPYRVIFKLLLELPENKISVDEMGLFVMGLKQCLDKDISTIAGHIIGYRNSKKLNQNKIETDIINSYVQSVCEHFKEKNKKVTSVSKNKVWTIIRDYARRHFHTLDYTDLCKYFIKEKYLQIPQNKTLVVRKILYNNPLVIPKTFNDEEEWFYDYGSVSKMGGIQQKVLSKKRDKINQMLVTVKNMKEKTGKIDIKRVSEIYEISVKDILKELRIYGYSEDVKEQTEHNQIIHKLALLGRKIGYDVHIGETEQGIDNKLKKLSISMNINHFGIPDSVFKELRFVDIVWLKKDRISYAIEVENSEVDREINKFRDLITTAKLDINYFLVVPDKNKSRAFKKLNSVANEREGIINKIKIYTFADVKNGLKIE